MTDGDDSRKPDEVAVDPAANLTTGDAAAETTGASVLGGGVWLLTARLWPQISTLALSIAVARFLGPDDFGRQSYIAFVSVCAITFFSGGLSAAVMRWVAELLGRRRQTAISHLIRWSLAIQLSTAALGGGALVLSGVLGAEPPLAWVLVGVATSLAILQTVPHAVLTGMQRFRQAAIIGLTVDTIAVPATIAVLIAGGGIAGIFGVQAVTTAISLAWTGLAARVALRERAPRGRPQPELWRGKLTRFALYNTVIAVLVLIVWRRSEFFFLEAFSTDAEIGIYSIAFAAATALSLIPGTLAGVVIPAFATLFGAGAHDRMLVAFGRAMRVLLLLALGVTTATVAIGPELLEVVYGPEYAAAGDVLLIMIVLFPLLPIYQICNAILIGMGRALAPLIVGVAAAAINIGLNFLLIPGLDAIGAAIANALAQITVMVPIVIYTLRLTGRVRIDPATIGRAATASGVAGVVALSAVAVVGGVGGVVLGAAAWLVGFAAVAIPVGVLSADDASWIDAAAGERLHGLVGFLARALARSPRLSGV